MILERAIAARAAPRALAALAGSIALGATGCGDNRIGDGPALAPADTLIVIAHLDDDMIFMQPELHAAIEAGSLTTVYVSSGDPVKGDAHAEHTFEAAMIAYASVAHSSDWECGYLDIAGSPVHHCRLRDRGVSMIGLDTADGAPDGQYIESPLHLVEGVVASLAILGPIGGRATTDSITAELAEILALTRPAQIHTLDLSATHGSDHSGHLFAASFALWAAARIADERPVRWHRGYDVGDAPITLSDSDYARVMPMLAFFDACYFGCGLCGAPCATLDPGHDRDLRRQYSSDRAPLAAQGALALDATGGCVSIMTPREAGAASELAVSGCAGAPELALAADGHLRIGDVCLSAPPSNDDAVAIEPCRNVPSQYWVSGEGMLWNGLPPSPAPGMDYDHVRCLSAAPAPDATGATRLIAPICGSHLQPRWRFVPATATTAP